MIKKERLIWVDTLRGFLILLVVLGHSLQYGDFEHRLSWRLIYSFHMAAFFVISGFVCYKNSIEFVTILKRAKVLMLPFITWTLIVTLFVDDLILYFKDVLIHPDIGFWFLYILFIINVLFFAIDKIVKWSRLSQVILIGGCVILLAVLMALFNWRSFGFQFVAYYFFYYSLGYYLRKYKIRINYLFAVFCILFWFICSCFWFKHEPPIFLKNISYLSDSIITSLYSYMVALLAIIGLLGMGQHFQLSENSIVVRLLSYLGKVSLGIYVIHIVLAKWLRPLYEQLEIDFLSIEFIIFDFSVKLVLSILAIELIKRNHWMSLLLLGKDY